VILSTVEMHTGGEPTRIIVDGWPEFSGKTLLDKRREAKERFDHLRRGLMLEPRGHDGMYGALLVEPDHPDADLAVLFMHNEGYSTMCGHATIALARWAVDSGRVARREPETPQSETVVRLQCPCGLVTASVASDGTVRFESVPAFAHARDRIVPTRTWGPVTVDVAYGGAFYAILAADSIGLDLHTSPMRAIVDAGEEITKAAAAAIPVEHADEPDLAFLYGTILTDGGDGADRSQPNRQRRDRAPGARGSAPQSGNGRGAAVRELHRRGLQRQGFTRGAAGWPREVGDRRSGWSRPSDGRSTFSLRRRRSVARRLLSWPLRHGSSYDHAVIPSAARDLYCGLKGPSLRSG
jgi:trans-L-3-hydroxyproline dehydratase